MVSYDNFCYNKMFSYINKTFGLEAKFLVAATNNLFVGPNFVAVTKPFFSREGLVQYVIRYKPTHLMFNGMIFARDPIGQ